MALQIVIHGTNGGYKTIYSTNEKIAVKGLDNSRADTAQVAAIGKEAYALQFTDEKYIFSKYRVIRDGLADKRTGNIAFSIIFPNDKRLAGQQMRALLDEVSEKFYEKNIVDDNLFKVSTDMKFIVELLAAYENKLVKIHADDIENYATGTEKAAYVYYASETGQPTGKKDKYTKEISLAEFLDAPYQKSYQNYKQIFFVDSYWEKKEGNPLNALRHDPASNLTGTIDLDNPYYMLRFYQTVSSSIQVELKGKILPDGYRIRKKHELVITYSKNYHESIQLKGKPHELAKYVEVDKKPCELAQYAGTDKKPHELAKYVVVDDEMRMVRILSKELVKNRKTIQLSITDSDSYLIKRPFLKRVDKYGYWLKKNELDFLGEEIGEKCMLIIRKGNLMGRAEFVPDKVFSFVSVKMSKMKEIKITMRDKHDNKEIVSGLRITMDETQSIDVGEIVFYGNEVDKKHVFKIEHPDYHTAAFECNPGLLKENEICCLLESNTPPTKADEQCNPVEAGEPNRKESVPNQDEQGEPEAKGGVSAGTATSNERSHWKIKCWFPSCLKKKYT